MARRDFRQLGLADSIVRRRGKKSEWLERLDGALDWPALERIVAGVYASREGGLAYPLLTYVKLLLLQQWYGLSDEGLEAAVDDDRVRQGGVDSSAFEVAIGHAAWGGIWAGSGSVAGVISSAMASTCM